jgi:putative redox protein
MTGVTVISQEGFRQEITAGAHTLLSDEPSEAGGRDAGPDPYELLLAALGACTSMTIRMYADRKQWSLEGVRVELEHEKVHARDCAECETTDGFVDSIRKRIYLSGDLTAEQAERLLSVARRCPVHLTLTREVQIADSVEIESAYAMDDFPGQA